VDDINRRLLALLKSDARQPTSLISRKLGISRSTVHSRMLRLEQRGIISGYTVRLSDEYARNQVKAHVQIMVAPKLTPRVSGELSKMPEVTALYSISGAFDMIAILAAETTARLDSVIDEIGNIAGIERTTTSIVLSTKFER